MSERLLTQHRTDEGPEKYLWLSEGVKAFPQVIENLLLVSEPLTLTVPVSGASESVTGAKSQKKPSHDKCTFCFGR